MSSKISTVVPTCHISDWLFETIDSVVATESVAPPAEIIIYVNAGGNSQRIAEQIRERVSPSVRVAASLSDEIVPMARNWNNCVGVAEGDYVHLLHDDDRISPYFYHAIYRNIEKHPGMGIYSTGVVHFHEASHYDGGPDSEGIWKEASSSLKRRNYFFCPGVVFKKNGFPGFDESLEFAIDWKAWVRISENDGVCHTRQPLAFYRNHNSNATARLFRSGKNVREISSLLEAFQQGAETIDYSYAAASAFAAAGITSGRGEFRSTLVQLLLGNRINLDLRGSSFILARLLKNGIF